MRVSLIVALSGWLMATGLLSFLPSPILAADKDTAVITKKYDIRPALKGARDNAADRRAKLTDPLGVIVLNLESTIEQFEKLFAEMAEPDSWKMGGGPVGEIKFAGGFLVVKNTAAAHEQIDQLMKQLRKPGKLKDEKPGADTPPTIIRAYDVRAIKLRATGVKADAAGTASVADAFEQLVESRVFSCAPKTWRDKGGSSGAVRIVGGLLVISNTAEAHEQIEIALNDAARQ